MNIVKQIKNKNCSVIHINELTEPIDNILHKLPRSFDVYVYINRLSKIDPIVFSNLYNIHGYIYGDCNEVNGTVEILKYMNDICHSYYSFYILSGSSGVTECEYITDKFSDLMMRGVICSSIFESEIKNYEFRSATCMKLPWWRKLLGHRYGTNSTHYMTSGAILVHSDIENLVNLDKSYISSFDRLNEFIPSSFNKLEVSFMNINLTAL